MSDTWKDAETVSAFLQARGGIPLIEEQTQVLLDLVGTLLPPPARILDLGCGDGITGELLLRHYPATTADFIDGSPVMVEKAKERLGQLPGTRFLLADLETVSLPHIIASESYDVVVSSYAIHHLTDRRKRSLYQEILIALRPGGLFVNLEHVAVESPRLEALAEKNLIQHSYRYRRAKGELTSMEEVAARIRHRPDKDANILAPTADQCEWLKKAGFQEVDCFFKYYEFAVFGGFKPDGDASGAESPLVPPYQAEKPS